MAFRLNICRCFFFDFPTSICHDVRGLKFLWTTYRYMDIIGGPSVTCSQHSAGASSEDIIGQNMDKNFETPSPYMYTLHPPFSSLLGPNICLRILFSNTLSLQSSLNVRDHVSHPCSTTGNIIVLCILIFKFLDTINTLNITFLHRWEDFS